MKRIYLIAILFLCFAISGYTQQKVDNLFIPKKDLSGQVDAVIKNYNAFNIDFSVLAELQKNRPEKFQLNIPFEGKIFSIDFHQIKIVSDNFSIVTSSETNTQTRSQQNDLGIFYAGKINGKTKSIASISIFNNQVMGVFSDEVGNINLGSIENGNGPTAEYILYRENNLNIKNPFECFTKDDLLEQPIKENITSTQNKTTAVGEPIEFYYECDYALYQSKGSNVANVINYVLGFFNNVAILYANENVKVQVSQIKVWTTADPYIGLNTTSAVLNAFAPAMLTTNYVGDFAHFLSTRNLGGGVAYLLNNGPCGVSKQYRTGVSGIYTTYSTVPTYSWTVEVVTHEMGHNLGSNHTQWCGWVGGAIDNCYTTESGCAPGPAPTNGGGTIMSYCHLTGYGINFNNGFGQQPGDRIRGVIANATCYGTCKMTLQINSTNIGCGNTSGQATVTPTDGTGNYTYNWSNGQTTSTITGLTAGSYYVSVKDAAGCEVMTNVVITNSGALNPVITATGSLNFCTGESVSLQTASNASYSYQWYNNNVLINGATQNTYTATTSGVYTVKITSGSCSGLSAAVTATLNPNPVITVTPANSVIKKFATQTLTATGASSYNWTTQPGYLQTLSGGSAAVLRPLTTTTYTITGTTSVGCKGTAQATITVIGCGDVTDTIVKVYSPSRVVLKWKNPQGSNADSVYYRIASSTNAWTGIYVTTDSVEVDGLTPNTQYEYYITALCSTTTQYVPSPQNNFKTLALSEDVYIKIFPNPIQSSSRLEVIVKENAKLSITIVNNIGQTISTIAENITIPTGQTLLPMNLPTTIHGNYFVVLTVNGKKYVRQIIR